MPPHDPTLWLESDSDLSSEPSGLPNAELGDVDAVVASAVLGLALIHISEPTRPY